MYRHFKNNTTKIHLHSKDDKALKFLQRQKLNKFFLYNSHPPSYFGNSNITNNKVLKEEKMFLPRQANYL